MPADGASLDITPFLPGVINSADVRECRVILGTVDVIVDPAINGLLGYSCIGNDNISAIADGDLGSEWVSSTGVQPIAIDLDLVGRKEVHSMQLIFGPVFPEAIVILRAMAPTGSHNRGATPVTCYTLSDILTLIYDLFASRIILALAILCSRLYCKFQPTK